MLTPNEARTAILSARCAVVYFTKRDGALRHMVCHVPAEDDRRALSRNPQMLTVWDVEKGDVGTVNLATVESVRPVKTATSGRAADRKPILRRPLSMDEISALFAF